MKENKIKESSILDIMCSLSVRLEICEELKKRNTSWERVAYLEKLANKIEKGEE